MCNTKILLIVISSVLFFFPLLLNHSHMHWSCRQNKMGCIIWPCAQTSVDCVDVRKWCHMDSLRTVAKHRRESILWALTSYDAFKCCLCWQLSRFWNRASMWNLIWSSLISFKNFLPEVCYMVHIFSKIVLPMLTEQHKVNCDVWSLTRSLKALVLY